MSEFVSDEQKAAHIASLIRELEGYKVRGLDDRVAQVEAELARLGAKGAAPAKRATKRSE